jgi:hypothetical protein
MHAILEFPAGPLELEVAGTFLTELHREMEEGGMSLSEAHDLLSQIAFFEQNQTSITQNYPGKTVAVIDRQVVQVDDANAALRVARERFGGRALYVVSLPGMGSLPPLVDAGAATQRYVYTDDDGRIRISR